MILYNDNFNDNDKYNNNTVIITIMMIIRIVVIILIIMIIMMIIVMIHLYFWQVLLGVTLQGSTGVDRTKERGWNITVRL